MYRKLERTTNENISHILMPSIFQLPYRDAPGAEVRLMHEIVSGSERVHFLEIKARDVPVLRASFPQDSSHS